VAMPNVLRDGVYTLTEAARLTRLRRERVKQWFEVPSGESGRRRVFQSDYEALNGRLAISFLDLIELNVGGHLRDYGLSLTYLRRVRTRLREEWETKHPFCLKRFRTEGRAVLARALVANGPGVDPDGQTRRRAFDTVVLPFLKTLDYSPTTHLARRWHVADMVVLDPEISSGRPVVEGVRIKTSVLAASFYANDEDAEVVARWFGVKEAHVRAAVAFQASLTA
jgi:uncharacterized protein (DUF433 family)